MSHVLFEEAVPLYAVGALDRDERQSLEAHLLSGCADCHAALKDYRTTAAALPYALPGNTPPKTLKRRVMALPTTAQTAADPAKTPAPTTLEPGRWMNHVIPPEPPFLVLGLPPAVVAAVALLIAGVAYAGWTIQSQLAGEASERRRVEDALRQETAQLGAIKKQLGEQERQVAALQAELNRRAGNLGQIQEIVNQRDEEIAQLQAVLAAYEHGKDAPHRAVVQRDAMLAILRSGRAKVISLAGQEHARSTGAFLLYDEAGHKAFFHAVNLPPPPAGKAYHLWVLLDKPVGLGTLATDAAGTGWATVRRLPSLPPNAKIAVSLEPAGGRPQPTGEGLLVGQF
jgi:anti-sigma-K factor RskA